MARLSFLVQEEKKNTCLPLIKTINNDGWGLIIIKKNHFLRIAESCCI
jgi:hypothetical protein